MHRRRLEPIPPMVSEHNTFSRLSHVSRLKDLIMNLPQRPDNTIKDIPKLSAVSRSDTVDCLCTPTKIPKLRMKKIILANRKDAKEQPVEKSGTTDTRRINFQSVDWWGKRHDYRKLPPCRMISFAPLLLQPRELGTSKPFSLVPLRSPQPQNVYSRRCSVGQTQSYNEYSRRSSVSPTASSFPETFRSYIQSPELATGNARTSDSVLSRIQSDFTRFPSFVQMV